MITETITTCLDVTFVNVSLVFVLKHVVIAASMKSNHTCVCIMISVQRGELLAVVPGERISGIALITSHP